MNNVIETSVNKSSQTLLFCAVACLVSACVNPAYYESTELQRYTIPKYQLPPIGLVIWPYEGKSQRICIDNDYGGRNCFTNQDNSREWLIKKVKEMAAFKQVVGLASSYHPNDSHYFGKMI